MLGSWKIHSASAEKGSKVADSLHRDSLRMDPTIPPSNQFREALERFFAKLRLPIQVHHPRKKQPFSCRIQFIKMVCFFTDQYIRSNSVDEGFCGTNQS